MHENKESLVAIKRILRLFTDDFTAADIRFISRLSYPVSLVAEKPDRAQEDDEKRKTYTLESLCDLENVLKCLLALDREKITIAIDDEGQGRLLLVRRVE